MTEIAIDWETEPSEIEKEKREVETIKFELFSAQKTTTYPSDWKQRRIRFTRKVRKKTDFQLTTTAVDDDAFPNSIRIVDTGVSVEPHLLPDELVRFLREKPLIAFTSPEVKSEKPFGEAAYQWAKKKMSGSKQR